MGLDSLGAGTDFPVNPINPFLNMYIMVTQEGSERKRLRRFGSHQSRAGPAPLHQCGLALHL